MATRNLEKQRKDAARGNKDAGRLAEALERVAGGLDDGVDVRSQDLGEVDRRLVAGYRFLTDKDVLYVANVSEDELGVSEDDWTGRIAGATREEPWKIVALAARLEAELAALPTEDRSEFLEAWGLREPGLTRLIEAGYRLLDLVTFFTIKGTEVRAWTVPAGTPASVAAGRIHSDMETGFIRAEVVGFNELASDGSMHGAREKGHVRTEGRDYAVQDGDVILIHFH
jgi:ribosome-binding ATPase YchF (GTP1/OBG family)